MSGCGQVFAVGVTRQAPILPSPHRRRDGQIIIGDAHMPHPRKRPFGPHLQQVVGVGTVGGYHRQVVGLADQKPRWDVVGVLERQASRRARNAARVTENRRDLVVMCPR